VFQKVSAYGRLIMHSDPTQEDYELQEKVLELGCPFSFFPIDLLKNKLNVTCDRIGTLKLLRELNLKKSSSKKDQIRKAFKSSIEKCEKFKKGLKVGAAKWRNLFVNEKIKIPLDGSNETFEKMMQLAKTQSKKLGLESKRMDEYLALYGCKLQLLRVYGDFRKSEELFADDIYEQIRKADQNALTESPQFHGIQSIQKCFTAVRAEMRHIFKSRKCKSINDAAGNDYYKIQLFRNIFECLKAVESYDAKLRDEAKIYNTTKCSSKSISSMKTQTSMNC